MIFNIDFPTKVLIGAGAADQTGKKLKEYGVTKVLCIYDEGIKSAGVVEKIVQNIQAEGIKVVEFSGVVSDPPDTVVNEAGELGNKERVDAVLGIGGGSCLDTAKATNILLGNPGPINKYDGVGVQNPGKLLFLMPTTAGTGSEVSQIAAITDSNSGAKMAIFGPNCTATLAIVDPLLTLSLPAKITAATGVDTLAHAMEAYTSSLNNPMADILAVEAISRVARSLRTAVKDGRNVQARFDMSFACTLAGMAFMQSPPHFTHAIGTQLGAKYHLAHGLSVAVVLPLLFEYLADVFPAKLRVMGQALGLNLREDLSDIQVAEALADAVRRLNKEVGLPTLKEIIPGAELPAVAEETFKCPCAVFMPKKITVEEVLKMLDNEYAF
ncbi:Alcohol dehydrogenase, iron-type [Moorella glycerini]|uniref:Alcohol dehydrogenase 2 n=1 Tax=Neomoorella stamsii TaxID=1266720 RepID=A0A9X7IZS8_9FIRM|nr:MULTISPECIES: iron-containing alcohol dehydrogenase [Moorella]PRR68557.1 Alcohol dehydrogenase 2 [Moorella stamsii]CEP66119.1 Alcohol dehydrogenase, iron-type [Moorella glycerini]